MRLFIQAACACHTGKIRKKNEDNFYFNNRCLEQDHDGLKHPVVFEAMLSGDQCFSVFDGMGGENFGEYASFAAARQMQQEERKLLDYVIPARKYLTRLVDRINKAVWDKQQELGTERMGTTMVSLMFTGKYVYVCNLGDSRAYRFRDGEFLQLSTDHVESHLRGNSKKAPLTQYLGINPEEMQIEPYIAKGSLKRGDKYLICSDGLTDMLTNLEISDILMKNDDVEACAQELVHSAIEHGGRDNITVIVCLLA